MSLLMHRQQRNRCMKCQFFCVTAAEKAVHKRMIAGDDNEQVYIFIFRKLLNRVISWFNTRYSAGALAADRQPPLGIWLVFFF